MTDCEGVSSSTNSITAAEVEKAPDSPDKATSLELLKAQSYEQNIKERKKYAHRIFLLICFWLAGVFLLLVADGESGFTHFSLPEGVVLAIIGSTTLNVLGIFVIVTHYLFPQQGE
jgi:hypothetical protein